MGKELFTHEGPSIVKNLQDKGFEVFLDLKFHDIPNTVAKAVKAAADLGVWMVNVHASGGSRMMIAAREALQKQDAELLFWCQARDCGESSLWANEVFDRQRPDTFACPL